MLMGGFGGGEECHLKGVGNADKCFCGGGECHVKGVGKADIFRVEAGSVLHG